MTKLGTYIRETVNELYYKVSWPTWEELQSSSIIVLIASVIFALSVFVMDYVMGINGSNSLLGWKGVLGYFYSIF
ncbi:MAG: preprotein translocase subunit SecE [Flavobacteriales bacterium]